MSLEFRCPYCGQVISAPEEAAGVTGTCRYCSAAVIAPTGPGQPAELVQRGDPRMAPFGTPDANYATGIVEPGALLAEAWHIVRKQPGAVLGSSGIAIGLFVLALMPLSLGQLDATRAALDTGKLPEYSADFYLYAFLLQIALAPLLAGPLYVIDRLLARGEVNLAAVFHGYRHWRPIIAFSVLYTIPGIVAGLVIGTFVQVFPALNGLANVAGLALAMFMWLAFRLGLMEIVDRDVDALTAFRVAWQTTRPYLGQIAVTWLFFLPLMLSGLFLCGFGVFLSFFAFRSLAEVLLYRQLRGLESREPVDSRQ